MEIDPDKPPVRIILPKDNFQIGVTPEGEPVWVDPKEFLINDDEKLEIRHNIAATKHDAEVHKLALVALANAEQFFKQTVVNTSDVRGRSLYMKTSDGTIESDQALFEYIQSSGYECVQDGLDTIVKLKGKVIRHMTAKVHPDLALSVAQRIMLIMKKG